MTKLLIVMVLMIAPLSSLSKGWFSRKKQVLTAIMNLAVDPEKKRILYELENYPKPSKPGCTYLLDWKKNLGKPTPLICACETGDSEFRDKIRNVDPAFQSGNVASLACHSYGDWGVHCGYKLKDGAIQQVCFQKFTMSGLISSASKYFREGLSKIFGKRSPANGGMLSCFRS